MGASSRAAAVLPWAPWVVVENVGETGSGAAEEVLLVAPMVQREDPRSARRHQGLPFHCASEEED